MSNKKTRRDFFGNYVAPGMLLGGLATAGIRTLDDLKGRGTISAPWRQQREQRALFDALQVSRKNRYVMSSEDIASAFTGKGNFESAVNTPELRASIRRARGHAVESLATAFKLEPGHLEGFGIDLKSGRASRESLIQIMDASPAHRQYMELIARQQGLIGNLTGAKGRTAAEKIIRANAAHIESNGAILRISDLTKVPGKGLNAFNVSTLTNTFDYNPARLAHRPGLLEHMNRIEEFVNEYNSALPNNSKSRLQMKMMALQVDAEERLANVHIIQGNRTIAELPIEMNGRVRLGTFGERTLIARRVRTANFEKNVIAGVKDINALYRSPDEYFAQTFADGLLKDIVESKTSNRRFYASLIGHAREDTGKPLVAMTANMSYNRKLAYQVTLRGLHGMPAPSADIMKLHDELLGSMKFDVNAGLSPTQQTSGIRNIPNPFGRIFGSSFAGMSGDNKTIAQSLRGTRVSYMQRAPKNIVRGSAQLAANEALSHIRVASVPQDISNSIFRAVGLSHINLHEDEMVLLDKIKYRSTHTVNLHGSSFFSDRLGTLVDSDIPGMAEFRERLKGGIAVSEIEDLMKRVGVQGGTPTELAMLESTVYRSGEVLGLNPNGTYETVPENAERFIVNRAQLIPTKDGNKFVLNGELERTLGQGDKGFGMKVTIKEELDNLVGRKMAAMYEVARNDYVYQDLVKRGASQQELDLYFKDMNDMLAPHERAVLASGGDFVNYRDAMKGTPLHDAWNTAWKNTEGLQGYGVQGLKKISERTMPQATEAMVHEISGYMADLEQRMATTRQILMKGYNKSGAISTPELLKEYYSMRAEQRVFRGVGLTGKVGSLVFDESKGNLAENFDKAAALTVKRKGRGMWSASKLFEDLSQAEEVSGPQREAFGRIAKLGDDAAARAFYTYMRKGTFTAGGVRTAYGRALQSQLQYGIKNHVFSIGGNSAVTSGSGRMGSISMQMAEHGRAQGGAMADAMIELLGRRSGFDIEEGNEVYRRVGVFMEGISPNVKAITALDLQNANLDEGIYRDLISRNQLKRSKAFSTMRETFDLGDNAPLVFDVTGKGDKGRYIYHPEEISKHTGGFTGPGGRVASTKLDTALVDTIESMANGNEAEAMRGAAIYGDEAAKITIGKNQSPTAALSGPVSGSSRLRAQSNLLPETFAEMGLEGWEHKPLIRESEYEKQLRQLGADADEIAERMADLRSGKAAMILSRDPPTEMFRISAANVGSLDKVLEKHADTIIRNAEDITGLKTSLFSLDSAEYLKTKNRILFDKVVSARLLHDAKRKAEIEVGKVKAETEGARKKKGKGYKTTRRKGRKVLDRTTKSANEAIAKQQQNYDFMHSESRELDLYSRAIKRAVKQKHAGSQVMLPKHMELIFGADFDDDQLNLFAIKDRNTYDKLKTRSRYHQSIVAKYAGLSKQERDAIISNEEDFLKGLRPQQMTAEHQLAEEGFIYKIRQAKLYSALKDAKEAKMIEAADVIPGTPEWNARRIAAAKAAELEKGSIGAMTNATDFSRRVFRQATPSSMVDMRLYGEMLYGVMPESPLKARQIGAGKMAEAADHIEYMMHALQGKFRDVGVPTVAENFRNHFLALHGTEGNLETLGKIASIENTTAIIESAHKAVATGEGNLLRTLRGQDAGVEQLERMITLMRKGSLDTLHGQLYKNATAELVAASEGSSLGRHVRNAATSFEDVYSTFLKHKKPLLVGAGLAIATSMLLSSPGNISSEVADGAEGAHRTGEPTTPPMDMGNFAPVAVGSGKSIRITGSTSSPVNSNAIAERLKHNFPDAGVNLTVNDYRSRINEEYIRRRIERGS